MLCLDAKMQFNSKKKKKNTTYVYEYDDINPITCIPFSENASALQYNVQNNKKKFLNLFNFY